MAHPEYAHSVHVDVTGLEQNREYWYRFRSGQHLSPVGRTRTAPAPGSRLDELNLVVASCQSLGAGWYHAWRDAAAEPADLVYFAGDYIYEYQVDASSVRWPYTLPLPEDYARRTDTWTASGSSTPSTRPTRTCRRRTASRRGYSPGTTTRWSTTTTPSIRRCSNFGRTDTVPSGNTCRCASHSSPTVTPPECIGASPMAIWSGSMSWTPASTAPPSFQAEPSATFRHDATRGGRCSGSSRRPGCSTDSARVARPGTPLANTVLFSRLDSDATAEDRFSTGQWDSYQAAQQRVVDAVIDKDVDGFVVLTGDIHRNYHLNVLADFEDPDSRVVGVEFAGTSISSGRDGTQTDAGLEIRKQANPHPDHRGPVAWLPALPDQPRRMVHRGPCHRPDQHPVVPSLDQRDPSHPPRPPRHRPALRTRADRWPSTGRRDGPVLMPGAAHHPTT